MAMFAYSSFNENINAWNVSLVENMEVMFHRAKSFNQPLDKWSVRKVKNIQDMLRGQVLLIKI